MAADDDADVPADVDTTAAAGLQVFTPLLCVAGSPDLLCSQQAGGDVTPPPLQSLAPKAELLPAQELESMLERLVQSRRRRGG